VGFAVGMAVGFAVGFATGFASDFFGGTASVVSWPAGSFLIGFGVGLCFAVGLAFAAALTGFLAALAGCVGGLCGFACSTRFTGRTQHAGWASWQRAV